MTQSGPSSVDAILEQAIKQEGLLHVILNGTHKSIIRPLKIRGGLVYQITTQRDQQAFHQNVDPQTCEKHIKTFLLEPFKSALICTPEADYQISKNKQNQIRLLKHPPTRQKSLELIHNRSKNYLLKEGEPIPFLIALGVMSPQGKVVPKKYDKFRQLNRFLEIISDLIPHFPKNKKLRIIDFGCGKAYLTFALYHYLTVDLGYSVTIHGLDLKKETIEFCQRLATSLSYSNLTFSVGDIQSCEVSDAVDMVISLHACDTATDAALHKAISWGSEVILAVPCCQHELFSQIKCEPLNGLLRHGILKERFAALATDAVRVQLLEVAGYHTQILEFIDMEHTPKNLLIRAVKRKVQECPKKALNEYHQMKQFLVISPTLERILLGQ